MTDSITLLKQSQIKIFEIKIIVPSAALALVWVGVGFVDLIGVGLVSFGVIVI